MNSERGQDMSGKPIHLTTQSVEETQAFGRRMGAVIRTGCLMALNGDLGSGKTTFVQGLANGLDVPGDYVITSPTFTLINEYPGRLPLFHVDLYRISDGEELENIGFFDLLSGEGVVAVEWADRVAQELPDDRIDIRFEVIDDVRRGLEIRAGGQTAGDLVKRLQTALERKI